MVFYEIQVSCIVSVVNFDEGERIILILKSALNKHGCAN